MKHIPKRILACALALLLCLSLGSAAAAAPGVPTATVTLSYADVAGFQLTPQTQFTIPADLCEEYGFDDGSGGEKVSVMDAIVYLHLLLLGKVDGYLDTFYYAAYDSTMITNFMGDGMGAFLYFLNGEDPELGALAVEITDGDTVELFSIYDAYFWTDVRTWFEVGGQQAGAVTALTGETLELTLNSSMFGYPMGAVEDADILQLAIESAGDYNTAAFAGATVLATTGEDGAAQVVFPSAGTYILSATLPEPGDFYDAILAPWLVVTVLTPEQLALAEAKAAAKAALDAYKKPADYREAQKTELANAIAAGKAAIDAAADIAGVNAALAAAKLAMDAVKTDAQLKAQETLLAKWHAKLPKWMKGVEKLWNWLQYVLLFVFFGWVFFLF